MDHVAISRPGTVIEYRMDGHRIKVYTSDRTIIGKLKGLMKESRGYFKVRCQKKNSVGRTTYLYVVAPRWVLKEIAWE